MGRRVTLIAVVACSGTNERTMSGDEIEAKIRGAMSDPVDEVVCPDTIKVATAESTVCTATFTNGPTIRIRVSFEDDRGTGRFHQIDKVLSLDRLEVEIGKALAARGITVDCGAGMRIAKAGDAFECTAKDPTGADVRITGTVDDAMVATWSIKQ